VFTIRLFGFDIEIQLTFLILAIFVIDVLSGIGILLWMLAAFVSIVIHELGHAIAARGFGGHVERISIHAMGGVTYWRPTVAMGGIRRFLVAAAGSATGIVLGGGLFLAVRSGAFGDLAQRAITSPFRLNIALDRFGEPALFFLSAFIWVSFVWGLFNWLPIGGLDGSKMLRELLVKFLGPRGAYHAAVIGMIVAGAFALWAFQRGFLFGAIIVLILAFSDLRRVRSGGH
jgi:Zn-dependent protease